jgi:2-polyprenyl-3-methyl-5-hydroxy-6-metoxy-1,4-benzoquinol methylase
MSSGSDYYRSFAARWPNIRGTVPLSRMIMSVRESGRLLEVGCGRGMLLELLAKQFDAYGTDISELGVAESAARVGPERVFRHSIEDGPPPGRYEVVLAINVLEHIHKPEIALRNINAVLEPGGTFIFTVPNNSPGFGRFATWVMDVTDRSHVSALPWTRWRELCAEVGFEFVEARFPSWFGILTSPTARRFATNALFIYRKPAA